MRRTRTSYPAVLLLATLTLTGLALTGCTTGNESSSDSTGTSEGAVAPDLGGIATDGGIVTDGGISESGGVAAGDQGAAAIQSPTDRAVVTTGFVSITAKDPIASAARAVVIVEGAGGRVDGRTETAPIKTVSDATVPTPDPGSDGHATLALRIPAAKLTPTLDALKKLGTNVSVQISVDDVTTQTQDLDARITALGASVDRLLALLATATDTKVLIELETAISSRQGELDGLQSQRRYLSDQVAMSAITLDIGSEDEAPVATPDTFWGALAAGFAAFAAFFVGLFLVLGYAVPWLLLLALGSAVALAVLRRRKSKNAPKPKESAVA